MFLKMPKNLDELILKQAGILRKERRRNKRKEKFWETVIHINERYLVASKVSTNIIFHKKEKKENGN